MNWRGKSKREPQFRFVFGDLEVYDYIWLCLWVHFEPEKFQLHQERAPDQVEDIMITYDNNISYTVTTYNNPGSSLATAEFTKGHIQVDDCLRFLWSRGLRRIEPLGCVIPKGYKGMETLKNNPWNNGWNWWNWWNDHWKCNKKHGHFMPKKSQIGMYNYSDQKTRESVAGVMLAFWRHTGTPFKMVVDRSLSEHMF